MRPIVFGGNWKMHMTWSQTEAYLQEFVNCDLPSKAKVILFAPFTSLAAMRAFLKGTGISFGAQNFYPEEKGAFTGEVSASMLLELGVTHVLVGHSERRSLFLEEPSLLNRKVKVALSTGLVPMYCIGETLSQREAGQTAAVLRQQIFEGLEGLSASQIEKMQFAYEPVWAIGTGKNASADDAREGIETVRSAIRSLAGAVADQVSVVYGGSVKNENIATYMAQPGVDGGLVGGASLKPADFAALVRNGIAD